MVLIHLVVSAALYCFSFSNSIMVHGFFFGGWLAAIPFLFVLDGKNWRARMLLGLAWGGLAHGLLLWWFILISWAGYAVFVLALALQGGIFALLFNVRVMALVRFPADHAWRWIGFVVYVPSAWVVSEYARNMILGGFTWGLGMSQAMIPEFIQTARWGGVYAVSWLLVFFAGCVFWRIKRKGKEVARDPASLMLLAIPLAVWILGAMGMALRIPSKEAPLRVVAVQPNILHADKMDMNAYNDNVARHLVMSKKGAQAARPDMIVWPETAFTDDILRDDFWRSRIEQVARNFNAHFILGSALLSNDGHDLNALLLLDPRGQWKDVYYKKQLVPFSEYLPQDLFSKWFARVSGISSYHFLAGRRSGIFYPDGLSVVMGMSICSEEAYPALFRALVRKGAGVFVSSLNDGWFARPEALLLHAQMAVFRAVEAGRPLVRAANTGWSAAVDHDGRVLKAVPLQSAGWVAADVHPRGGETVYVKFGDVFAWLCAGFVILINIVMLKRNNQFLGSV